MPLRQNEGERLLRQQRLSRPGPEPRSFNLEHVTKGSLGKHWLPKVNIQPQLFGTHDTSHQQ